MRRETLLDMLVCEKHPNARQCIADHLADAGIDPYMPFDEAVRRLNEEVK